MKDFRAGVDYPISFYYKELMKAFPNAKIILSTRKPEGWYKSVNESIFLMSKKASQFPMSTARWLMGYENVAKVSHDVCYAIPDGQDDSMFGVVARGESAAIDFFEKWNDEVIKAVPKDRLLIHEAKDGYEPICKFLGLPVPNEPYPRVNDTQQQLDRMRSLMIKAYAVVFGLPVVAGVLAYFFLGPYLIKFFN